MLECIRRIEYNISMGQAPFLISHTIQDAVLRNLQTLAEASQRLSDALRATQPHKESSLNVRDTPIQ
ncbi:MAG: DUF86 domain-containing protein [Candidatus Tectomicrobia bacterium]|nr:DUF86 domain-containing protein [Candidatus Tectomicrobia bacterium]